MDSTILILILTFSLGFMLFALLMGLGRSFIRGYQENRFDKMLSMIAENEVAIEDKDANLPKKGSWGYYWYSEALKAGMVNHDSPATPGRLALALTVVSVGFAVFIWPREVFGVVFIVPIALFGLRFVYRKIANSRLNKIEKELPLLLSGIQAQLRANLPVPQAIISQATEIPEPLSSELKILKNEVNVGVPLQTALSNFAVRINSREVDFLVSAIQISLEYGASLENLITIIQRKLARRMIIANHLSQAIAKAQPSIIIAAVAIPAGFLYSYFGTSDGKEYWFVTSESYLALLGVAFLYVSGLIVVKKLVQKVEEA